MSMGSSKQVVCDFMSRTNLSCGYNETIYLDFMRYCVCVGYEWDLVTFSLLNLGLEGVGNNGSKIFKLIIIPVIKFKLYKPWKIHIKKFSILRNSILQFHTPTPPKNPASARINPLKTKYFIIYVT